MPAEFEASYRTRLSDVVSSWDGNVTLRFLATNYIKNYSSNGINPATDTAGQNTGNGPPSWRWTASAGYGRGQRHRPRDRAGAGRRGRPHRVC